MTCHKSFFYSSYFHYMKCVSNIKEHFEHFLRENLPSDEKISSFDLIAEYLIIILTL